MADVSGTDVHYTSDSKLGLTTLTFRKRRYMFPSVVVAGSEPHGGSTSSLQSTGACLMLDVGLFCPHCSGAISAQLSESHSKLVISKEDGGPIASLHGRDVHCLQLPAEQSTASSGYTTTIETVQASPESPHRSKHAKVKKIQTEQETRDVKVPRLKLSIQPESSQNTSNLHQSINVDTVDKLSSSDYESLDQDSRFGSLSSTVNSAEVVHSPNTTGVSSPRRDDAYSSMVSSGQGCGTLQGGPDFPPTMHSSLPRNIHFSSSIHDSRARLNNVYTNMMSQSDHSAVDDVFRKDLLNGHGDDGHASGASSFHSEHISQANGEMPKAFNEKTRSEDELSNRSTSPETFVDDILENVGGEVYSVDATLPRVFSLKTEHGRKSLSAKRKNKRHRAKQSSNTAGNVDHNISAADFKDAIRSDMKSSFSHEEFFEEIFEALTELEEGQTPDWNSVFNVDRKETASTPDSGHVVDEQELEMYKNGLGYFEKRIPNPPTSSCECLADDRSRDLDSSFEHFPSMAETPSETSAGDYSLEGYMSSSEGSEDHSDLKPSTLLMDQLIEDTRILTESLNVLSSEEIENVSVKDQYDVTDEVFLDNEQNAFPPDESAKVPYSGMTIGGSRIPRIIQPEERYENVHDDMSNDSDDSSIQESSSLENLLSCNALHCSTSDLDEPYATELKHNGIVEEESECVADDSRYQTASIEEDFQKCLQTKTHETDEFVPEKDQDKKAEPQVLKEAYEAAQYVASLVGSHQVTEPKLCSAHAQGTIDQAATEASVKTDSNSSFDTVLKSGDWKDFSSEADTKVASFETKENMSKEQAQQFLKYVLSQSSHTQHTQEHTSDLDACLDEVCQTCEMKPEKEEENIIVKNEEVTTQEVTFVFAWPKKLAKGRNLVPTPDKSGQPFRTLHLRRVMRVSDFDMEVVEGPTIETVEYTKEGTAKRSIQAYEGPVTTKQLTAAHHDITEEQTCDSDADLKHQAKGSISVSAVSHGVNTAVLVNQEDTTPTNKCDSHDHTSELEDTILTTQNEVHHATDEIVSNTQDGYCAPETDSGRTTIKRDQASSVRSAMDGPASPTFIEQRERNVKLLKLDKYFSPSSSSEEVSRSESGDLINGPVSPEQKDSSQIFLLQTGNQPETAYETCSEIPLCAMDIADKRSLRRYGLFGHPVPCERCIQLERELREKLDELSTMVEFLGRRTSLAGSKSASDSDRVELDSQPEGSTFSVIPNMGFSNGLDFDSGTEVVATENDAGDEIGDYLDPMREIEHYAENMSKYILFRAKLHIVLKNATIVPPFVPTTVPSDLGPDAFRVLDPATSSEINGCS